jgi:nicotinate phosphoribosyltransferase
MKWCAGEKVRCVEFGLRRAQGPNGAMTASKYSFLGGFDGTSNVEAGFKYGIPIVGTHAHSFVMSYNSEEDLGESRYLNGVDILEKALAYRTKLGFTSTEINELYAFVAYACSFPRNLIALVDSYSTMASGVPNFLVVYLALYDLGYTGREEVRSAYGVRLDSGDLAKLSIESKALFARVGEQLGYDLSHLLVVASNDINEKSIIELKRDGHRVDMFGIGTNLVTCQAQPALGMVYKLVEIKGTATVKLSEEPTKTTLPGEKQIIRVYTSEESAEGSTLKPAFDLLCLAKEVEEMMAGDITRSIKGYTPFKSEKTREIIPAKLEVLSELLYDGGKQIEGKDKTLKEKREGCLAECAIFGGAEFILNNSDQFEYEVLLSENLNALTDKILSKFNVPHH